MTTVISQQVHLEATIAGRRVPLVLEAECRFNLQTAVASASFVVPNLPSTLFGKTNQEVVIRIGTTPGTGNGPNSIRFRGYLKAPTYTLDGHVQWQCTGKLSRAAEYTNQADPDFWGGLTIQNLTGLAQATYKQIVQAALTRAGVSYLAGNIRCTGRVYDSDVNTEQFLWGAGTNPDPQNLSDLQEKGASCLAFLLRWSVVEAFFDDSDPENVIGGFYQLVENLDGQPCVVPLGGRPRGVTDHTFTETLDILDGSIQRQEPLANVILVKGLDDGFGFGPYFWKELAPNDVLGGDREIYDDDAPSSPMIEWESLSDAVSAGYGMDCETVAKARSMSVNRQTPQGTIVICTDNRVLIGQTALVQGNVAGQPKYLGTGENLWVIGLTIRVARDGTGAPALSQSIELIGGGQPDNSLPGGVA